MTSLLLAMGIISVCLCVFATTARAEVSDPSNELLALLHTFHETYGFPGATVAYVNADDEVRSFSVGLADVEAGIPMTPDTRMLAGSVGKTVWGALVLSLEADGVIEVVPVFRTVLQLR